MKKMIALAMAMTMGLSLVACGSSDTAASTDTAAETTEAADTADTAEETEVPSQADPTRSVSASWYSMKHWMQLPRDLRMPS